MLNFARYLDKETGLLKYRADVPIEAQGAVLENTGKFFLYCNLYDQIDEYKDLISSLITSYERYEIALGTIPRTVSLKKLKPYEPEKDRWEGGPGMWYRTDVSQSQIFYFIMGLSMIPPTNLSFIPRVDEKFPLFYRINKRIVEAGWKTTRLDNKPSEDGNFLTWSPPLGNALIRALCLEKASNHPIPAFASLRAHTWIHTVFLWKVLMSWSDKWNYTIALWWLSEMDDKYKKHYKKWIDRNPEMVHKIRRNHRLSDPSSSDFMKHELNYMIMKKIV